MSASPAPLRVLLGITGGIAAYKSAELVRLLKKAGHQVQVAMTQAACEFVGPTTFQALSGNPVFTDLWDARMDTGMAHIDLSRQCDLMLVAPATADFIAKLAHGHADDLLSTLSLARNCTLAVAPAMNLQMWQSPPTRRNIAQIQADGVHVWGPGTGEQACGEIGDGRMLEAADLAQWVARVATPQSLAGKTILITAGPTFEPIDPVRGITNRSSGKMGYALAQAMALAGAQVVLVSGPTALPCPWGVRRIDVLTARDMLAACQTEVAQADVFVGVAAVADWTVSNASPHKRKKTDGGLNGLDFELNPDILASMGELKKTRTDKALFTIGFAAETQALEIYAEKKRHDKNCDWVVGNLAQHTLGQDSIEIVISTAQGPQHEPRQSKWKAACALTARLGQALQDKQTIANRE
jgi:phosphopantothenoylcysteine decarboxylase/phosphopantothenate--cysteine ligase